MSEKKDLAALQALLNELARTAMDAMRHMATASPQILPSMGYKTNADAVLSMFKFYRKQMDDAIAAHIKKYPD